MGALGRGLSWPSLSGPIETLLDDEYERICAGEPRSGHRIQVPYNPITARWYPIAKSVLHQLVVTKDPVEFVPLF